MKNFKVRGSPNLLIALAFIVLTYAMFFGPVLLNHKYIGGADAVRLFYPARYYLWEQLHAGRFPFWTERMFGGYPIFADPERAFLNPVNVALVFLFGPFVSYSILHFGVYLIGGITLYYFLKKHGFSLAGALIAHTTYFYSFFMLYHQQHFNMVLSAYLLPALLHFLGRYIETKRLWFFFLTAAVISFAIYLGSLQMVLIMICAGLIYVLSDHVLKDLVNYGMVLLLALVLSLPQLLPSVELYQQSSRAGANRIDYKEGSFNPLMLINLAYPNLFGEGPLYKWNMVSSEFLVHETYVYVSISALVLALLGVFRMKSGRLKTFLLMCLGFFLVLGFIRFIPYGKLLPPPFTLFRYWGRSVVLAGLAAAIFAGSVLGSKTLGKYSSKGFVALGTVFILVAVNALWSEQIIRTVKLIQMGAFKPTGPTVIWLGLVLATAVLYVVMTRVPTLKNVSSGFLVMLVLIDVYVFGHTIVTNYGKSMSQLMPTDCRETLALFKNQRAHCLNYFDYYSMGLYYQSWGVLGYSQLIPGEYKELLTKSGIADNEAIPPDVSLTALSGLGVVALTSEDEVINIMQSPDDLVPHIRGVVKSIERGEGHLVFKLTSSEEQHLDTRIRNYPGWEVFVNGARVPPESGVFLSFPIGAGELLVELTYVPTSCYWGIGLLAVLSPMLVVVAKHFNALKTHNV